MIEVTLKIPDRLGWLVPVYQQKAEVRSQLPSQDSTMEDEMVIALEQYALQLMEPPNELDGEKL